MSTKFCTKCKQLLSAASFFKRADGPGLRAHCKKCGIRTAKQKRHEKKPPKSKLSKEQIKINRLLACKKFRETDRGRAKQAANEARRRAVKLSATPSWLTQDQLNNIELFYALAKYLTVTYGQKIEVDHIIPLRGREVRGLHVPWNLQLMVKSVNQRKGNRLEPIS